MPLTERDPERSRRSGAELPRAGRALFAGVAEIVAIAREMVRIPAALWMGAAERAGAATLAAWRRLWPPLVAIWRAGRRLEGWAERELTPARATAVVLAVAIGALAASQFVDYREVRAGVPDYAGVEDVAPPPVIQGSAEATGSAHAYVVLALAAAAAALLALACAGRWRLARLLAPVGLAVIAIAILIDAPTGLDEGALAIQFEGAEASLLAGFWAELAAGGVIAFAGPLLAAELGASRRPARARRPAPPLDARLGRSPVEETGT
jgi:hypothetical protein